MKDSKKIRLHVGSIVKKMERHAINFDHPLQRASEQWSSVMKGNLISDILQENPIPDLVFAEQEIHEAPLTWGIDGKQRCTNIRDFINNGYSISKNIERYLIEYAVPVLDEDGVQMRDEDNIVIHKTEVCDIRGKKFKALPKELQERILDYGFDIVLYYDCSEENLAYHIKRYNEGRAMNAEQKGITRIGTHFASMVKNISSMAFFEDGIGKYTSSQFKNGKIYRIIVESIMTTRFLDQWFKDYGEICEYIKENATNEDFEEFRSLVESLEDLVEPSVGQMFDSKYSFLWFGLYARFTKLKMEDSRFNEFMAELNNGIPRDEKGNIMKDVPMSGLCIKEIDGVTFEELLKNSSTKDTNVVKTRIDFLTKLMCDYLNTEVSIETYFSNDTKEFVFDIQNEDLQDFAQNFVSDELALQSLMLSTDNPYSDFEPDTIKKMVEWYKEYGNKSMLDDCVFYKSFVTSNNIAEDDVNMPFYIYAVKYIMDKDKEVDIDEWFSQLGIEFFSYSDDNQNIALDSRDMIALKCLDLIENISKYLGKEVN